MNNPRKTLFIIGCGFLLVVILWSIQGTLAATKPSPRVERFQNEIATLEESVKHAQSENEIRSIEEQLKLYYQMATLVATMQPTILCKASQDPAEIGPVDLVIFCTKTYDTETAARQIIPLVGPRTTVMMARQRASRLPNRAP